MKPDERLKTALQSIAHREVPETTDLWQQIANRLEKKEMRSMKPALKPLWILVLVLLALMLVSGAAYALYTYFLGDAGMEAVSRAGLVSEPNVTALPPLLPTATPLPPAVPLGKAQTLRGVTLTLNWVYLDEMWQAIGFSAEGLAEGQRLGIPQLVFDTLQPRQYRSAGMLLSPTETGLVGKFVVHQLVRNEQSDGIAETHTDMALQIPLLDANGDLLETFRFTAAQVLIHRTPYGGGNTYAVRANGLEVRLAWVIVAPTETRARLCYEQPLGAELKPQRISLQGGQDLTQMSSLPPLSPLQIDEANPSQGERCVEVLFPPLEQEMRSLQLKVAAFTDASQGEITGDWEFIWAELPWQKAIPGIDVLEAQSIGEVKVTLLQAYADALRVVVVCRIEGAAQDQGAFFELLDQDGKPFNTSSGMRAAENNPNDFIVSFNFAKPPVQKQDSEQFSQRDPLVDGRFVGKLKITLNPWAPQNSQVFTFDLDLPAYPALLITPAQTVTSEGLAMRLEKLEITPSFTKALLCYQKPTQADWMLSYENTSLQIGQAKAPIEEYSLVFDADYGIGMQDRPEGATILGRARCVEVGFAVGHHQQPETLTLTVALEQSVPEVIPEDQLQAAREKLRLQGIEMDWVTFSGNGGGGAGPQIKQKPADMTEMEVLKRFYEALGYTFPANWTFTIDIQP